MRARRVRMICLLRVGGTRLSSTSWFVRLLSLRSVTVRRFIIVVTRRLLFVVELRNGRSFFLCECRVGACIIGLGSILWTRPTLMTVEFRRWYMIGLDWTILKQ